MTESLDIYETLLSARQEGREADAAALLQKLHAAAPDSRESLTLKVVDLLERGHYLDALHCANSLDGQGFPELRALSLYFLDDPLWEAEARSLARDENPYVAAAMRKLLENSAAGF